MKALLGFVGILTSIILGLYLGLWVCFIGGGIDIIHEIANAVNGTDVSGLAIMWGIVKMGISSLVGWLSFYVLFIPSVVLMKSK